MKQKIYCAVKRVFEGAADKEGSAHIMGVHFTEFDATCEVLQEYRKLEKYYNKDAYAELTEFGSVRGLIRVNNGWSYSLYVREGEVEI